MTTTTTSRHSRGFTLTELLVVIGLIAVLISLLFPVLGKVRSAAQSATCMSNLRQMGNAWSMYTSENKGRLLGLINNSVNIATPDVPWRGYWTGMLDDYKVRGRTLLCPAASESIPFNQNKGYGNVAYAWTGKYQTIATPLRFNPSTYRESSYGFNLYLTAGTGFGQDNKASVITLVKPITEVPVFMDALWADFKPSNYSEAAPLQSPPNLYGDSVPQNAPDAWRFLIARHGRAINVCFADGSVRRVPLEDTYKMMWKSGWKKYALQLPQL
jgi:prepilin-type N-terminal cleavage/methylation domain-containing protein/prepilin-type processing-associated H-X9-DG protein